VCSDVQCGHRVCVSVCSDVQCGHRVCVSVCSDVQCGQNVSLSVLLQTQFSGPVLNSSTDTWLGALSIVAGCGGHLAVHKEILGKSLWHSVCYENCRMWHIC
jgi:hypothetical protein